MELVQRLSTRWKMLIPADPESTLLLGREYPRRRFGDSLCRACQLHRSGTFGVAGGIRRYRWIGSSREQGSDRRPDFECVSQTSRNRLPHSGPRSRGSELKTLVVITMSEFGRTARENRIPRYLPRARQRHVRTRRPGQREVRSTAGGRALIKSQLYEGRDLALHYRFPPGNRRSDRSTHGQQKSRNRVSRI